MKTAREIAARVWCDPEMSKVAMDTDAAEQIAIIIQSVRQEQAGPQGIPNRRNFDDELVCLLNKYSKENGSNTPDFILADFIGRCLENWNLAIAAREKWHGRKFSHGSFAVEGSNEEVKRRPGIELAKTPLCRVCGVNTRVIVYPQDHSQTICPDCCADAEHANGEAGHEWEHDKYERDHICLHCGVLRKCTCYEEERGN